MSEVWLRSNRRVISLGFIPAGLSCAAGVLLYLISESAILVGISVGLFCLGVVLLGIIVRYLLSPRVAYADGHVLFYLRAGAPIAVPVHMVEAFFLGQGPAHLPLAAPDSSVTVNLVARISQKAPQWAEVDVKPALGRWSEGYISIRGSWCEPLTGDVIRRLNRRLAEVTREQTSAGEKAS